MALGKQAKVLTAGQVSAVLGFLTGTRHPVRNRAIFLLSVKAGLRAKEIASVTWSMVTDSEGKVGQAIHLQDVASKGRSGRVIPMNRELRAALVELHGETNGSGAAHVIQTERSDRTSAQAVVNMMAAWYAALGFDGASSHSGRRTFITNAARKIGTVGGSLKDVQDLAGHSSLQTTQRYIAGDAEAARKIVDLV